MNEYKSINYNTENSKFTTSKFGCDNVYSVNNDNPIYAAFLNKKKKEIKELDVELIPTEHNKSDVIELEKFCKKYGILAANFGNIPPAAALRMLKNKMGIYEVPNLNKKDKRLLNG